MAKRSYQVVNKRWPEVAQKYVHHIVFSNVINVIIQVVGIFGSFYSKTRMLHPSFLRYILIMVAASSSGSSSESPCEEANIRFCGVQSKEAGYY